MLRNALASVDATAWTATALAADAELAVSDAAPTDSLSLSRFGRLVPELSQKHSARTASARKGTNGCRLALSQATPVSAMLFSGSRDAAQQIFSTELSLGEFIALTAGTKTVVSSSKPTWRDPKKGKTLFF